jgi:hypothetical protein
MSAPFVQFLTLLTVFATPSSADVCVDTWPMCSFNSAFETSFGRVGFPRPKATGWPELYQDGGRPVVRYFHLIEIDDSVSEVYAQEHVRFADLVSAFSSEINTNLCASATTADFVNAGGIVEFWIVLDQDLKLSANEAISLPEKLLVRVETCEAP